MCKPPRKCKLPRKSDSLKLDNYFNFRLFRNEKIKIYQSKIVSLLKEYEAGKTADSICRANGISKATFYNWKKKYGGMDTNQLKKLKELEQENARLKRMYADLSLDHQLLKEILEKSSKAF